MILCKVIMENFRGFINKTIDFQAKPVVLFSAANGIGKTTTLDAIEWCLTGGIGRLKATFDTRSTNDKDRARNTSGILKHRDAGKNDKARVFLWLLDGEEEHILCREQTQDELDPIHSKVTLDGSEEAAEAFIREYIGNSFYNFHFCDIQKSFNIQSQKRTKLDVLFREFITNYDDQQLIAENLDIFAEDVKRHVEDKNKQKTPTAVIDSKEAQLAKAREKAKQVTYPAAVFYPEEKTVLEGLDREALQAQKEAVQSCGYQVALEALDKLVKHEALKSQQVVLREIVGFWETKGDAIRRAINVGFQKNTNAIEALELKLDKLNHLSLTKKTILRDGENLVSYGNDGFTRDHFDAAVREIGEKTEKVKTLSDEIDLLSKNNKMLKLLSSLTTEKQAVIQYRDDSVAENGAVRCPVCGSESFATKEANEILQEAEAYIRQNGATVERKTVEKAAVQSEIEAIHQKLIRSAKSVVEQEKTKITAEIKGLKSLNDEVQLYFRTVEKLQGMSRQIKAEEMTADKAAEMLTAVESGLLAEAEEQQARDTYQQILTVLGYKFERETVKQTHVKVQHLLVRRYAVQNFSYDVLVSKLNAIDSILANQELLDLQQQLQQDYEKNKTLDDEIDGLRKLRDKAEKRAKEIRDVVDKLSKDEYEKVGPALSKFYNKLARFNANEGIKIIQDKDGISLVDHKGKNIVNVLSNGQISVFMLAHFFAGISVRNECEKMKIYFIDDLTACMDDVNMLAFMDLLKYQMTAKKTMKQLFFVTCDDRISKLLAYKLKGRGIELCELGESDFTSSSDKAINV